MSPRSTTPLLLLLAYVAFVSLGLPDAVIGVAWPPIRETFALAQPVLGLLVAATAVAYFASGLLAGRGMDALGVGGLLVGSTLLVAVGLLGYALAPRFLLLLFAAIGVGLGSGAIDAALNTWAARHLRPRHMNWLHAAYSVGAAAGPVLFTVVIGAQRSWRIGYAILAGTLALLAATFALFRRSWERAPPASSPIETAASSEAAPAGGLEVLRSGVARLQIAIFFLYSGVEIAVGQWSYTVLTEARGLSHLAAGSWVAAYWGSLLAGRVLIGFVVEWVGQARAVRLAVFGAFAATVVFAASEGPAGMVALPLLAFFLAPIYPGLMSETPRRVGARLAHHAVGFQVSAATAGIAAVPALAGLVGDRAGLEAIGWVAVVAALLLLVLHERLVALADR